MDPNSEAIKTKPVLPGNRPDYVTQEGMELAQFPNRIIAPIYAENFARTVMCVAILQIIKPDILFWPISLDEVADMRKEIEDDNHQDWYMMDLDNSVEKLIAKCWKFFDKDMIVSSSAASKMAVVIGRAIDRECSTVNSVFVNMLHSGYDQIVRSGVIYGATGYSGALQLKHQNDNVDVVRQMVSETVLDMAEHVTPLVKSLIEEINSDFMATETVRDLIDAAHEDGVNYVVAESYFPIGGDALRLLNNDPTVHWVLQIEPDSRFENRYAQINHHYFIFPVIGIGNVSPLKKMSRKQFIEWAEGNLDIVYANPDTREGIEANSFSAAIEIIAALDAMEFDIP